MTEQQEQQEQQGSKQGRQPLFSTRYKVFAVVVVLSILAAFFW